MRGELVAVTVVPPGGLDARPPEHRSAPKRNLHLAEDLGAVTRIVEGSQVVAAIADETRTENATVLVLGHAPQSRWERLRGPSMIDQLLASIDGVGVHLVELEDDAPGRSRRR